MKVTKALKIGLMLAMFTFVSHDISYGSYALVQPDYVDATSLLHNPNRTPDKLCDRIIVMNSNTNVWESVYTNGQENHCWMEYSWDSPVTLTRSVIYATYSGTIHFNKIRNYIIKFKKLDASGYITLPEFVDPIDEGGVYSQSFEAIETTAIRIDLLCAEDQEWFGGCGDVATITEWEVYGVSEPPCEPTYEEQWVRQLGTSGADLSLGVSSDSLGSVYISGWTEGSLEGSNAGGRDAYVRKYCPSGNLLWTRQIGTSSRDEYTGISIDGMGNIYMSGITDGSLDGANAGGLDAFVAKYNLDGNLLWIRQLGTSSWDWGWEVSSDSMGNVYISGYTDGSLYGSNAGAYDAFIAKYDSDGVFQWGRQLGGSSWDISLSVSVDCLGSVYISGSTKNSLDGVNAGGDDAFVAKYDSAGNRLWIRQLGTSGLDYSRAVSADCLGNVYISESTDGSLGGPNAGLTDVFVAKYDSDGIFQWIRQFGTSGYDGGYGVSADGLGNVYISGMTQGSLDGSNAGQADAFVSKYDSAGNLLWTHQLGTSEDDLSNSVSADCLGNVYISGLTLGSLGGDNAGAADAFVAKLVDIPCEPPCEPEMVLIPGGEFEMGDHSGTGQPEQFPVHNVYVYPFKINRYEVTNAQYRDYLNSALSHDLIEVRNGIVYAAPGGTSAYCDTKQSDSESRIIWYSSNNTFSIEADKEDHPVVEESWYGAVAYCNWLSQQEGLEPCYDLSTWQCDFSKDGYRLPTEAEWEKACRAGTTTHFSFGDNEDELYKYANYCDVSNTSGHPWQDNDHNDGYDKTAPIGSFKPNPLCLYDMHGNVWEWCNDWYDPEYYSSPPYPDTHSNPHGGDAAKTGRRIVRGGCWGDAPFLIRSAFRGMPYPNQTENYHGFRLARNAEPPCGPDQEGIWESMVTPTTEGLVGIWGTAPDDMFAVGYFGTILHYDGDGDNDGNPDDIWEDMSYPTTASLLGVWGFGPNDVYVTGTECTILHYDGITWEPVPGIPTSNIFNLIDIWGSAPNNIFIAAEGYDNTIGHIIHWNGSYWSDITVSFPLTAGHTFELWGRAADDVYVSGYNGYSGGTTGLMYHYNGSTWELFHPDGLGDHDLPKTRGIGGIWNNSGSPDELFLAAQSYGSSQSNWFAEVLYYDGSTWQTRTFSEYPQCHGATEVWGSASDNVYVVGDYGMILHGGNEFIWSVMDSGTVQNLNGIWGTGLGDVFVVGGNGTILHLTEPACEPEPVNTAPDANAGDDQICDTGPEGEAEVVLDCSDSNDPDGDELTYTWYLDGEVIATGCDPIIQLPCGDYTIELIVNDGIEDSEPDYVEIAVEDGTPPAITCPNNVTLECPADTSVAANGLATATDNCDEAPTITYSDLSYDTCPKIIERRWTATDESSNSASCVQVITVQDTTPPVFTTVPQDITVECDGTGNTAELEVWLANVDANDTCGGVTITNDFSSLSDGCGATGSATVTWTATDECGNATTTSAAFTIVDTTPPAFTTGPQDDKVYRDGNGNIDQLDAWRTQLVEATDICGGASITNDFTSGPTECGKTGSVTVTWTATDDCGNKADASATFTIEDPTAGVTYDGDLVLSTAGNPTVNANLVATLKDEQGNQLDIDNEKVTFTLTADGVGTIVLTANTQDGVATVVQALEPAIYMITVTLECSDYTASSILVVYNPEGGFATGGGWIVPENDGLNTHPNERANFGFNAKYKQGDPTGHLEFRYSDGYIDLKSSSIEQLVITGGKIVQFKGWASVNHEPGHWFFVKAIDNDKSGNSDTFDIKIWAPGVNLEGDHTERAGGALQGGNIVVHTK